MATKEKEVWKSYRPPRETLLQEGASVLSDQELLAIFLRTGTVGMNVMALANYLLREFGSLYQLMIADHQTFCAKKGMGNSKFTQLQAAIELSRRFFAAHLARENALHNPQSTRSYLQQLISHREREIFVVMFLDNQHRVIMHEEMFSGSLNSVEVHPREIVKAALKINAAAIILAHNHPSGVAEPSEADKIITEHVIKACTMMDIRVLDHLVIGRGEYVSFAERGWI
ncbi:MAG: RadC family protein [Enterobacteriaceae bacterium]